MKSKFNQSLLKEVLDEIEAQGGKVYIVGGFVRDFVIGRNVDIEIDDVDIEIHRMNPERFISILENFGQINKMHESFGVYRLEALKNCDFAFARTEQTTGDSHRDFSIKLIPNASLEHVINRRDFTINSLYYDYKNNEIIDLKGGLQHCTKGILEVVCPSTFGEDCLRVFRGAQFISRFNLKPSELVISLSKGMIKDCWTLHNETILKEFTKLIKGKNINAGLMFLKEVGFIQTTFDIMDIAFPVFSNKIGLMYIYHIDQNCISLPGKLFKQYESFMQGIRDINLNDFANGIQYKVFVFEHKHVMNEGFIHFITCFYSEECDVFLKMNQKYGLNIEPLHICVDRLVPLSDGNIKGAIRKAYKLQLEGYSEDNIIEYLEQEA